METRKVWIVTRTHYYPYQGDDKSIVAIFDSEEKAEEFYKTCKCTYRVTYEIEEWEVEEWEVK